MITIIDYGAGNLFSVQNALNYLGVENRISSRAEDIISADKLILPGVGAFPDAMKMLDEAGLTDVIKEQAKLKPIRVHDLRHSHIALLIEKGMQPLVIAQRVGHDSVNTTMNIYGHLYPNKQKQVADLLNAEATGEPENNLVDMATEMRFRKAGGWS